MKVKLKILFCNLGHNRPHISSFLAHLLLITHKISNKYKNVFLKNIKQFYGSQKLENSDFVNKITKDCYFSIIYYKVDMKDYFLYDFYKLDDKKRKQYIGDTEKDEFLATIGNHKTREILNDKYNCYLKFQKYYKRDIVKIKNDKQIFENFCQKHNSFIIKPYNLSQGLGVKKVDLNIESIDKVWNSLTGGEYILEELIIQSESLAKLHPESVNTIRFATYAHNNKITDLFAVLRVGSGKSVIDNASAGGIFALINITTGKVESNAKNFKGDNFINHPDTNIQFKGFQIPQWSELIQIVHDIALSYQEHEYISFDLALTENGWVLVEANAGGGFHIYQIFGNGLRKILEEARR